MELNLRVVQLPSIGPVFAKRLKRLEINTLEDLLYHFPHRYEDFRTLSKINIVQVGEVVTIQGKLISIQNTYTKRKKIIQRSTVEDETGKLEVVWFNQPYLVKNLKKGDFVSLSGKIDFFGKKLIMQSPEYEKIDGSPVIHTGRLVPIYPETSSLSSKWIRVRIAQLLPKADIKEFLPQEIINKLNLSDLRQALKQIHFPKNNQEWKQARYRFAFEELFLLQLAALERKQNRTLRSVCHKLEIPKEAILNFLSKLPYELTLAQKRALEEVVNDIVKPQPMNRLLEGDVGSGKTVIAAIAAFIVTQSDLQTMVMAPTQILAQQHFQTLTSLLKPHGIKVQLLIGQDKSLKSEILNSKFDVLVGTHALLNTKEKFNKLALVVVDEQHKFGVEQRAILLEKSTKNCLPHTLTMTATPIPRTVALTLYGDLDLSILDELPPGRQKIITWLVPPQKREGAYKWIREQVGVRSQAFIVCPLIEESEIESMKSVRAATVEFKKLATHVFPDLKLGLLHGRLKAKEKEEEIKKLRNKEIDILVSTPVVEVGIDIPNATIMVVEAAERFGLAQLHQLRGRVGRGEKRSYCLLFTESKSDKVFTRLSAMQESKTGPELAELDLRLRGPGEVFGIKQHGFTNLKVASFSDFALIKKTRDEAELIFPHLAKFPKLITRLKTSLIAPN